MKNLEKLSTNEFKTLLANVSNDIETIKQSLNAKHQFMDEVYRHLRAKLEFDKSNPQHVLVAKIRQRINAFTNHEKNVKDIIERQEVTYRFKVTELVNKNFSVREINSILPALDHSEALSELELRKAENIILTKFLIETQDDKFNLNSLQGTYFESWTPETANNF